MQRTIPKLGRWAPTLTTSPCGTMGAILGIVRSGAVLLVLIAAITFPLAGVCQEAGRGVNEARRDQLRVVVSCSKNHLKQGEPVRLEVKLVNTGTENVSVFGQLLWGYAGGLVLHVSDQHGHPVEPKQLDDDMVVPSQLGDPTAYVVLNPDHFLGTERTDSASNLFPQPGSYALSVEYRSPIPAHYAKTPNFWGHDKKPIWSAPIHFEVLKP